MADYYWKLQKYAGRNTRYRCPNCGKGRQYTRFINADGEYAPIEYGKCNREESCGYFNYPNGLKTTAPKFIVKPEVIEFIDWNDYNYDLDLNSSFVASLIDLVGDEKLVFDTLCKYFVRTDADNMIYPFVDSRNRLTYVKKMHYIGLKRDKYIYTPYEAKKGRFKQCLFGLHLVSDTSKNCVVESEKTALICAMVHPELTWLATGGLNMVSKVNVLDRADIYPDKGKAYTIWKDKLNADKYTFSDMIENSTLPDGSDMADLIIENRDWFKK